MDRSFFVDAGTPGIVRGGFYDEMGGMLVGVHAQEVCDKLNALDQRWISVTDRLPEPHTHFLALNRDGYIFESCMCYGLHKPYFTYPRGDGNASNTLPGWINVTHWMPKP